jgi:mevalonate kinase
MAQELYKVIVPGSTMLLGEHAVLNNGQAVVCAINKYLQVSVKILLPSLTPKCQIIAPNFGNLEIFIDDFEVSPPFTFVLQAIKLFKNKLHDLAHNIELIIESQFASTLGFGSSSAVTVAVIAVLYKMISKNAISQQELLQKSIEVIRQVQGIGSGADLAASIYGGIIAYNAKTYQVTNLPLIPNFNLIYAGYKTPTAKVIQYVANTFKDKPSLLQQIYDNINQTVIDGVAAIKQQNYTNLRQIFDYAFTLQQHLQVSDQTLDHIVKLAGSGSKISGSGLGDCVITLNQVSNLEYDVYPIQIALQGAQYV